MFTYKDVSMNTSPELLAKRIQRRRGILLHETIGTNSLSWLQSGSLAGGNPASCDFLITREGDILQIGRPLYYTFHSGKARWNLYQEPDRSINQGFVGIELENHPGRGEAVTTQQYIACASLMRKLILQHDVPLTNIVGHYAAALPAGRKSDPATLNWAVLTEELLNPSPEYSWFQFPAVLP